MYVSRPYEGFVRRVRAQKRLERLVLLLSGSFKRWDEMTRMQRRCAIRGLQALGLTEKKIGAVLGTTKNYIANFRRDNKMEIKFNDSTW